MYFSSQYEKDTFVSLLEAARVLVVPDITKRSATLGVLNALLDRVLTVPSESDTLSRSRTSSSGNEMMLELVLNMHGYRVDVGFCRLVLNMVTG